MEIEDIISIKSITLEKYSIYIPLKTFNNYICRQKIYRMIFFNIDNYQFKTQLIINVLDEKNISINKVKYNSDYLLISKYKYSYRYTQDDNDSKTEIYLIEENGKKLKKIENFLNKVFDKVNIQKLIMLENKNIVNISKDGYKLSFFLKDDLNYKRLF